MSGTDIFLSYARHDRPTARVFAEACAEEGFSVWWDASLHSGETFDEVIERQLRDAKAVVVLWSPRSVASRWVRSEATLADRRHKLVPAIIEACDRPIAFELTHTAELTDWTGDTSDIRWRRFVEDLRRLVHSEDKQSIDLPRPEPAQWTSGAADRQSPARQPLRPGSQEVISADRFRANLRAQPAAPERGTAASEVHCLEVQDPELAGEPFVIDSSSVKIGRTAPADIVLSHKSISREHCIVGLANDELLVTDLNSTNGSYIDDVRISRATVLPVGSVLRIGEVSMCHVVRPVTETELASDNGLRANRVAAAS